jgi:hypothetical protein
MICHLGIRLVMNLQERAPFLTMMLVQGLFLLLPMVYHGTLSAYAMVVALLVTWVASLLVMKSPGDQTGLRLLRLSTTTALAVAPFCWFDLVHARGCVTTIHEPRLFLALILAGPPLVLRHLLTRPAAETERPTEGQWRQLVFWLLLMLTMLTIEVWSPMLKWGRLAFEDVLWQGMLVTAWTAAWLLPRVGIVGVLDRTRLPRHLASAMMGLLVFYSLWGR